MDYMDEMEEMMGMGGAEPSTGVAMPLCDRVVNYEVSEDFTLPDYQPEIRRVLSVTGKVMPPAKYVGGGNAEFNGTVDYRLLYVASDGNLYTAPLSGEYNFGVPLETGGKEFDLNEGVCSFVSAVSDHLSTRVTGPRKLSLRHRLHSHVRAYGKMVMGETVSGSADPESIQRLTAETERMCPASAMSELIEIREECALPSPNARVVSADSCVFVSGVTPRNGCLSASGEVLLKLMIEQDGVTELMQRKIPFEGEIEGEGFVESASARVEGMMSDLKVTAEEGRLFCEGELLLVGRSMYRLPLRYTEDLYSTENDVVCDYAEHEIPVALKCENRNLSQSERIPLSEARLPEGAQLLDAWGEARLDSCEMVGEKYVWSGQSRYSILCQKEGEYSVVDINLPLRYETEGMREAPVSFDGTAEVMSCRIRTDGEMLYLDAELSVCADYMGIRQIQCVSAVRFGEISEKRKNCMIVYYPMPGDTPWSVAKKYQVPQSELSGELSSYFFF